MNKQKLFPPLVSGFAAAVLTTVPGVKNMGCCLIVPLAAVLALFLDHKINKTQLPINFKTAVLFGILTGIFAAVFSTLFDVLITFITKSNDFVEALPQTEMLISQYKLGALLDQTMAIMHQMVHDIKTYGFSFLYTVGIFTSNLLINTIFGFLGGLIGMSFLNKRLQNK